MTGRIRFRELGIAIGSLQPGIYNAITDVPGVLVGHTTICSDVPFVKRTGVTIVMPRYGDIWANHVFAGMHVLNGNAEVSGYLWLEETGRICTPIALTNTYSIGVVRDTLALYARNHDFADDCVLPLVFETSEDWLSDVKPNAIEASDVMNALAKAASGTVAEGNVGGGTSGICYDFKGGIGTESRLVSIDNTQYTVGVLVQTNYGDRDLLTINGVPVGREITSVQVPSGWDEPPRGGSVVVVIATDAPLLPLQCKKLAHRAELGLALVGCIGSYSSGDVIIAFSTGNNLHISSSSILNLTVLADEYTDRLFYGVIEAVQEAVLNSLTAATTMIGFKGRTAFELPLDDLKRILLKYDRS